MSQNASQGHGQAPAVQPATPAVPLQANATAASAVRVTALTDVPQVQRGADGEQSVTAMLKVLAPPFRAEDGRRGDLNLCVAIDVSGSMKGDRLRLAIETLNFIVSQLESRDRLGIVAYDSNVYLKLPMTAMNGAGKGLAAEVSAALCAGSNTNLSGGLFAAVDQALGRHAGGFNAADYCGARKASGSTNASAEKSDVASPPRTSSTFLAKSGVISILLLTDGEANEGHTTAESIVPLLTEKHIGGSGIAVHTFGFGAGHNADLLRAISEATQGSYYFIEQQDSIKDAFANCLGGLLSVVMQRIVITAAACVAGATIRRVLTRYPSVTLPDGRVQVRMSDMYGDESRDTLVEVAIAPRCALSGSVALVQWAVEYADVMGGGGVQRLAATNYVTFADTPYTGPVDVQVDEQRRRLDVVRAIETARAAASGGNLQVAQDELTRISSALASAPSANTATVQGLMKECSDLKGAFASTSVYEAVGSKKVNMTAQRHAQQRSNDVSDAAMYCTSNQAAMKQLSKKN